MRFYDTVPVSGVRVTDDGYLVGTAPVARAGIQLYAGHEVGRPDMPVVRVYRPPEEVFSKDAMHSYAHRPITIGHPPERVTADNWKELTAGQTGDEVVRDGDVVRVPLALMDAQAIRKHEAGVRELSMGYDAELDFTDGQTPDGEPYDAVQRNQRMNHLALVPRARGGGRLRLGDNDGGSNMPEHNAKLRTVTLDGLPIETTDAGAQAIERLQKDAETLRKQMADAAAEHDKAVKAKDAELAKKDAEMDKLKEQVLSADQLDQRVQERADLLSTAQRIADVNYKGKTDAEIKRLAVTHKLGDEAVKDKPEAYIDARFDILAEDAQGENPANDALRQRARDGGATHTQDHGQSAYEKRLTSAWQGDAGSA